ncbi:3-oxoacyl-[acyl-carrier-protein] reductase [Alkaliphilus oremlandii]|uniref:3-oxoacyl-[acyl-carrier-protein] reductase n=1 Tax=Alkaliphilus oremlandii TaxID=461876 RepID=UPI0018DCC97B
MLNLSGKTALVTGGSRGIGRSIALALASQGANVIINYTSNEQSALEVVEEIKKFNVQALAVKANISSAEEVQFMMNKIEEVFTEIHILVNNAGITRDNLLIKMKEEDWDQVMDINLKGAFLCTKAVARKMIKQKYGRIINLASVVGIVGNPGQGNYCASKAGIIGFTKSIAKEIAGKNITVNAIAPGFIDTDMTMALPEKVRDTMLEVIPMKRYGLPEDIANLAVFLSSDHASYITGQVINVDGGMAM